MEKEGDIAPLSFHWLLEYKSHTRCSTEFSKPKKEHIKISKYRVGDIEKGGEGGERRL